MPRRLSSLLAVTTILSLGGCSLAPDFTLPDLQLPAAFKEQPVADATTPEEEQGNWKKAEPLEKADRGQWWKIFGDEQLNALETEAATANQSLKIALARLEASRATAEANTSSFLPNIDIGGNAVRAKPSGAGAAAFGGPGGSLKPYTLFRAQGVASYEADLFGRVRDNYAAFLFDAEGQEAAYRSALLTLQADVAEHYFALRALDSERQLLRDTVAIREEALRIMQHRYDVGAAGEADLTRTVSEHASSMAELLSLERRRSGLEHALAVLLGKMPSEFTFAESVLVGVPPSIPAGLPSSLLERRPDVATAQAAMAAANARIGVARTAFFPSISLTASSGYESSQLSNLFKWTNRTWALGQVAGTAITMPIFDSGRNLAQLDFAHASYDEAVAAYRQQVLVAFRDVEDNLANQRYLAQQSIHQDTAAAAAGRTTEVIQKRYKEGDVDFFEVVNAERDSLNAGRAAVQLRGQRFMTTITLIRALGGGWDDIPAPVTTPETVAEPVAAPAADMPAQTPPQPVAAPVMPVDTSPKINAETTAPSEAPASDAVLEIVPLNPSEPIR